MITLRYLNCTVFLIAIALLAGCATPSRVSEMTPDLGRVEAGPRIKDSIAVASTRGGKETNPLWTSNISSEDFKQAIERALDEAGLLGRLGESPYELDVEIVELEQPLAGFDMTVSMGADYEITESQTGSVVYDQRIESSHTATVGDAFSGVERLKLANEGAARSNIEAAVHEIMDAMHALLPEPVAVAEESEADAKSSDPVDLATVEAPQNERPQVKAAPAQTSESTPLPSATSPEVGAGLVGKSFRWSDSIDDEMNHWELTFFENGQFTKSRWYDARNGLPGNPQISYGAWKMEQGKVVTQEEFYDYPKYLYTEVTYTLSAKGLNAESYRTHDRSTVLDTGTPYRRDFPLREPIAQPLFQKYCEAPLTRFSETEPEKRLLIRFIRQKMEKNPYRWQTLK